jgi:uncharacterized protein YbbC (DUF1343 family)
MQLGIDRLLEDSKLRDRLRGKRVALVAHPASVTKGFSHSVDALVACGDLKLTSAFGPQHGMRGDKQDDMIESDDYVDPIHGIPVFSLYGKVRRPTPAMMDSFDVCLLDLQDVGCRIYTFLTTLLYMLEACAKARKPLWVLDRPNPAGRPVEGSLLRPGWESFVGCAPVPMRHGLTLGEAAQWFVAHFKLDVELHVVEMKGYDPDAAPGYGWPLHEYPWVNPSPNAASLSMARAYAGTVLIEGTTLSEGRGTTRPLETVGAPDLEMPKILATMHKLAPQWLEGGKIRPCHFEPTFQKHKGKLCAGFQVHLDDMSYGHERFKPYRLITLWLKAIRAIHPDYNLWRTTTYEYESDRLAIDLINGGPQLRAWVDDTKAKPADFEKLVTPDEEAWLEARSDFLIY